MKKSSHAFKLLFLCLILSLHTIQAQDSTAMRKIKAFSQNFVTFSKGYPQEKIYLHFDNSAYYLGESIWFKAYAVRADRNSLSPISKVLYVELLNAEGYVIETKKLKLENGQCHGDFRLNTTNYGGFYEVRAYTLYMLNFGAANYFSRVFPVYDAPKIPGHYISTITERPSSQQIPNIRPEYSQKGSLALSFFPEGGSLVAGLTSKVSFKATQKNGENAVISGAIFNEKNEKVADINTEYQGMGVFELTPNTEKYIAKVFHNNKEYKVELPTVLSKGCVMSIDNSSDEKLDILIQKNTNTKNEALGISISSRGILYGFENVDLSVGNAVAFKFPKKMLPSGVIQVTLYNTAGEILSERLVFVNHQSQMKISVAQNKPTYKPLEKVDLAFQFSDVRNNPVQTTFSLSVRDGATSSNNPYTDNILSDLLLSSEVSGYIENPALYFKSDDNSHRQALDLLLMTQGWRRYSWKQMAGSAPFVIKHTIENGLIMDGNVASVILKKKMKNVDVSMVLMSDSTSQKGKCKTDSVGNFNFGLIDFKGEANLLLQSKVQDKRKETRIMLNRQYTPDPRAYLFPELNTNQYLKATVDTTLFADIDSVANSKLSMEKREHLLQEITIREKHVPMKVSMKYEVAKEMDKMEDTGEWQPSDIYGFLNKTNKYIAIKTAPNGGSSLTYKGKNVRIVRRDFKTFATEVGDNLAGYDNSTTDKPVDENSYNVRTPLIDEIESIAIVEDFGTILRIAGGSITDPTRTVLVVITLKKNVQKVPDGIRRTSFAGYSYTSDFYSPSYNRMRVPKENDFRRTLYWNPDVRTDKDGKAYVSFYNNNSCEAMNIVAETVTENGVIGAINK